MHICEHVVTNSLYLIHPSPHPHLVQFIVASCYAYSNITDIMVDNQKIRAPYYTMLLFSDMYVIL